MNVSKTSQAKVVSQINIIPVSMLSVQVWWWVGKGSQL